MPTRHSQKITPHLWFDKKAREAAGLYASVFDHSEIEDITTLHNTPSGSVDVVKMNIIGQEFSLISAGPLFKCNPSISFLVACRTKGEVDTIWARLSQGGTALMPLGPYPFSQRYGWTQDRYGVSWQLMFMGELPIGQRIIPTLMFAGEQCGNAEQAVNFYASVFRKSRIGEILRYGKGEEPDKEGTIKHVSFVLEDQDFAAMDSGYAHEFGFNEAISFMVHCPNQRQIDDYWNSLSAVPAAEQCGWLKDKFGVSWQIVPAVMDDMMRDRDEKKVTRVTEAFLRMKKFDIAKLKEAYEGK